MRPLIQSALRTPLNDIFSTEAAVRVLRALVGATGPASVGDLAARTRLERSTTRRAVQALLDAGVVDAVGTPRAPCYLLRQQQPLTPALVALFAAERERFDMLMADIGQAVQLLASPPISAWIEGPVAMESDRPGEPVRLRVVSPGDALDATLDSLRSSLEAVEVRWDATIEVVGSTPADLAGLPSAAREVLVEQLTRAVSVAGLPPLAHFAKEAGARATSSRPRIRTHADHDRRSRATGAAIAARLKQDPTLAARAVAYVERRMPQASASEQRELAEWARVLRTMSPARLRHFLRDPGERATRLRQTLPFLGVLSTEERSALDADIAKELDTMAERAGSSDT